MKKHTPTPYQFKGKSVNGKHHFNIIGTHIGATYRICRVPFVVSGLTKLDVRNEQEAEATAKFIVKACNSHDKLVEENYKMKEVYQLLLGGNMCSAAADDIIKQLLIKLKS